jgi:hypothetical protein
MGLAQIAVEQPERLPGEVEETFAPGAVLESGAGRIVGRAAILEYYRGRADGFEEVRQSWLAAETHHRAFKVAWAGVQRWPGHGRLRDGPGSDRRRRPDRGGVERIYGPGVRCTA